MEIGKLLVIAGLALAAAGALIMSGVGFGWLGRLPGDINIEREGYSLHIPIVTCLLLSLGLSFLMALLRR